MTRYEDDAFGSPETAGVYRAIMRNDELQERVRDALQAWRAYEQSNGHRDDCLVCAAAEETGVEPYPGHLYHAPPNADETAAGEEIRKLVAPYGEEAAGITPGVVCWTDLGSAFLPFSDDGGS